MPIPYLKEFIISVPFCTQRTSLGAVLEIFSQGKCYGGNASICAADRLVVVSEQQRPLGVLHLSSLLPYLNLSQLAIETNQNSAPPFSDKAWIPEGADIKSGRSVAIGDNTTSRSRFSTYPNLQQPLSELGLSAIVPLATLPADFSLTQFWPYLQDQRSQNGKFPEWALVDQTGKFIGLLDTQRLLQFLADRITPEAFADWEETETPTASKTFRPTSPAASANNIDSQMRALNPLIQLLERLPLPMMLQTGSGESVTQNVAWRKHFGALQDPEWLRKEAAAVLEEAPPRAENTTTPDRSACANSVDFSVFPVSPSDWQTANHSTIAGNSALPKLCQLGTNPDSCICICPMQNGSERVWQFVKIPLGDVLASQELLPSEIGRPKQTHSNAASFDKFRLATLGSIADNFFVSPIAKNPDLPLPSVGSLSHSDLWLVLATDVTEQQQVAKELAAKNADLILLNRLKDEFLACISHELKTPLTAILGLSSLLKDRLLGEMNDRQVRYARLIHQSGRHLMAVVNDILDLTRMETGQLELTLAPVDIATACDRAYQQARQVYLGKHKVDEEEAIAAGGEAKFTLSIEPGLQSLIADEMRLRQMLVNLLSNALKFTEPTDSMGLKVNYWEGWIAFTVWDTGIGIPDQKQHLIFQKFQQLENPLTRQFDGTGLGLVLTQRLARLHGGDVTFISTPGKGSEFTLLLPPSPPKKVGEQAGTGAEEDFLTQNSLTHLSELSTHHSDLSTFRSPSPRSPSRLVLIVEAAPRSIEDLSEQLTGLGYRVVIARSGTEALEKARRLQPCAIFLNPLMPLLSGWDVLTLLKASDQTQHLPTIVTATRAEKDYAYSKRADGFLSLPVQRESLVETLDGLVNHVKVSQPNQITGSSLTILRLNAGHESRSQFLGLDADLNRLLHQYHYRVLEADDLEQAELLARIWQPDVVLLEGEITNPKTYLEQLSQQETLASLPLVTLEQETTQAAMEITSAQKSLALQVFPCLGVTNPLPEASILLQAIQVAAGMGYKPSILVVDISTLPDLIEPPSATQVKMAAGSRSEWLQALVQYLQTAGFKGAIGHSWQEVLQQVQHRSIDLLLIDLGDSIPSPVLLKALLALRPIEPRPSTLILTRRSNTSQTPAESLVSVPSSLELLSPAIGEVATRILPASLSMEELLEQIRQVLARSIQVHLNYGDRS